MTSVRPQKTRKTDDTMMVGPTTLNTAIQQACGDHKQKFSLVICHSSVATHLENLNLLTYLKYTDANGIERDLGMATWNGRLVIIDDSMPVEVKKCWRRLAEMYRCTLLMCWVRVLSVLKKSAQKCLMK